MACLAIPSITRSHSASLSGRKRMFTLYGVGRLPCTRAATLDPDKRGDVHCGTSYATPLVAGAVGAMLSVNPGLEPYQVRELLRRSAMTIGRDSDFEPAEADDLTAPILPSERGYRLDDRDILRTGAGGASAATRGVSASRGSYMRLAA